VSLAVSPAVSSPVPGVVIVPIVAVPPSSSAVPAVVIVVVIVLPEVEASVSPSSSEMTQPVKAKAPKQAKSSALRKNAMKG
jgi:hypothetical protein